MPRQIKAFVTCDSFIDNQASLVSPLYEMSDIALTYARNKQQYYSTEDALYSLYVFHNTLVPEMTQSETNSVLKVVKTFMTHYSLTHNATTQQTLISFMSNHNVQNPDEEVTDLTVSGVVEMTEGKGVEYLHFTVRGIECNIWVNDPSFRAFYPEYEIDIVHCIPNFVSVVQNGTLMLAALAQFNLVEFNTRIEAAKGKNPTTHMKILSIPYHLPFSTVVKECYFAFNQYGSQGNYDYVLKLKLYEYLLSLGMTSEFIESIFPSILQINEFFITPRWGNMAISSHVGQNGILSHVSKAYGAPFELETFIKVYPDPVYLKNNTYHVPCDYNNALLAISNGYYTDPLVQDFLDVYGDIITVGSTHPDFSRMQSRTQRFITLMENMLNVCNTSTSSKMFARMMQNDSYTFHTVSRQGVWYLTHFFEGHQYYMLPRFQFLELTS